MPSPLLPTDISPKSYTIKSKHNVLKSESLSGKILTRKIGGQRFEFTLVFPPMTRSQFSPIHAFLMEQEGMAGIFYIQIPTFSDSPTNAGEYANYNNHNKLYMLTGATTTMPEQITSGGSLVNSGTGVYARVSLARGITEIQYAEDGFVRFEVDLVERL